MCIRDRREHGATAGCFSDWWAYKFEVYDAIPFNAALMVETVSYTHLRAHETVLDLVCRLLLEKKTHITPELTLQTQQEHIQYIHIATHSSQHWNYFE